MMAPNTTSQWCGEAAGLLCIAKLIYNNKEAFKASTSQSLQHEHALHQAARLGLDSRQAEANEEEVQKNKDAASS